MQKIKNTVATRSAAIPLKQKTEVHNEIIGILGGNIPDAGRCAAA